jgi:predicted metal-dependent HD superfamily phosphohydrolase
MVTRVAADPDLLTRWTDVVGTETAAVGRDLLSRWSEPHREYHGVAHLRAVLDSVEVLAGHARDLTAVRLAAWFHDAVHEGEAGADEEASALLAEQVLPAVGVPDDRVADVARLVRLTAGHDPAPGDADGAVLCDADLAVLGGEPAAYAAYAAAVRREYSAVPDEAFRAGRAAVLERLLALDPLYRTPTARRLWAEQAAANLRAELGRLRAGPSGGAALRS